MPRPAARPSSQTSAMRARCPAYDAAVSAAAAVRISPRCAPGLQRTGSPWRPAAAFRQRCWTHTQPRIERFAFGYIECASPQRATGAEGTDTVEPEPLLTGSPTDSRDLIAAAAVGIISLDDRAVILGANAAALEMLGCSEDALAGLGAHHALNGHRPLGDCELESAVRSGTAVHYEDDTFRTCDGHPLPVWWAVNPLRDRITGELIGA